jgi:hypothetical protein
MNLHTLQLLILIPLRFPSCYQVVRVYEIQTPTRTLNNDTANIKNIWHWRATYILIYILKLNKILILLIKDLSWESKYILEHLVVEFISLKEVLKQDIIWVLCIPLLSEKS